MYIEDQNTELKAELTKDIKKEIVAFANTNIENINREGDRIKSSFLLSQI